MSFLGSVEGYLEAQGMDGQKSILLVLFLFTVGAFLCFIELFRYFFIILFGFLFCSLGLYYFFKHKKKINRKI